MSIEENRTLVEWDKLLERYQAGEVKEADLSAFLAGAQVMHHVIFQAYVAADAEWRLHLMQLHEQQTELLRRQTVALERIAKVME